MFADSEAQVAQRKQMVAEQIRSRGISQAAILQAMEKVPRHVFVPAEWQHLAYQDAPLSIPCRQTISQPYVVALMIQALDLSPEARVLEVGTGSGYAAALLAQIAAEVYTIERYEELVQYAQERFARLGYQNIFVLQGDGTLGWPEHAPYQGIIVAASGPYVPPPLQEQLAVGGCLVMPVGPRRRTQDLVRLRRLSQEDFSEERFSAVRFVPLVGAEGWRRRRRKKRRHD